MKNALFLLLISISVLQVSNAQDKPRFWYDVQTIRHYDVMYTPPADPILFIGSSSIRKWNDLERTFAPYVAMNRGIGGAEVNDVTFYLNDIVFPYHPRQIVLYVGENDLPYFNVTADTVLERTKKLIFAIRSQLPDIPITYISIKPSPSRDQFRSKAKDANALIKAFVEQEKNITFVDIFTPMLDAQGNSRKELFVEDMLHMNQQGYAIWRAAVEPTLLKK